MNVARCSVLIICLATPALAETGTGTLEDPVTRSYTELVLRDWTEGVAVHPGTGNYLVTYKDAEGLFNQVVFEPATKLDPAFASRIKLGRNETVSYEYAVKNSAQSRQKVRAIRVAISSALPGSPTSPVEWRVAVEPTDDPGRVTASWSTVKPGTSSGGLAPGKSARGFQIESADLPGVAVVRVTGAASQTFWLAHVPDAATPVGAQVNQLLRDNFVPRMAAVPRIPAGSTVPPAAILDALRAHVTKDLVELGLIEPGLAATLARALEAAAAAARSSDLRGAFEQLEGVLKLIVKTHPRCGEDEAYEDQGDRRAVARSAALDGLAARVIAFDVLNVAKRLRGR